MISPHNSAPAPSISDLTKSDRKAIEKHFIQLNAEDRRLRFGLSLLDPSVIAYVSGIDFDRDALFGFFGKTGLDAVAHLARRDGTVELGLSVLPHARRRGLGRELLARSETYARSWGVESLRMQCLTENAAMMRIALKRGMTIVSRGGEANAYMKMPPADVASGHDAAPHIARLDNSRKPSSLGIQASASV